MINLLLGFVRDAKRISSAKSEPIQPSTNNVHVVVFLFILQLNNGTNTIKVVRKPSDSLAWRRKSLSGVRGCFSLSIIIGIFFKTSFN
jgi:hypothetical protein